MEDLQVVAEIPGGQEVLADMLLAAASKSLPERGVVQNVQRALGAVLHRRDEVTRLAVLDLERDAADVAADERAPLPERLGHGQAEALARGLLDHDVRKGLERVHLDRADV